jgi:nitronate monooxygenase
MRRHEALLRQLAIRHPLIQAPMAGVSTPRLAAAVSEAGALGSLGTAAAAVDEIAAQIRQTRELTAQPFNVNLFCHAPAVADAAREADWLAYLTPEFRRFGAQPPATLREIYRSALGNDELLAVLLALRPAVVSFHFGLPDSGWIPALREAGIVTLVCVTDPDEAVLAERAGADVLVAQGYEAGGHRGIFDPARDARIGTFALVRLLARRFTLPVVAAGGIMDGSGIAAALQLGAAAVQMGTAFILCPESAAGAAYRERLRDASARHTGVTAAISGRAARGLVNRLHELGERTGLRPPDYPIAYDAGKALHQAAAAHGNHDYAVHWAGQGAPLARELPAAQLVQCLIDEWHDAERAAAAE